MITDAMCKKSRNDETLSRREMRAGMRQRRLEVRPVGGCQCVPAQRPEHPGPLAGQRVKIKGTLYEKTKILKADTIEALKK